jgi:steroid 5-alpha reductase family enzyme
VGKGEDPGYTELLARGAASPTVNAIVGPVAIIGVVIWAAGLFFEGVGDAQMERYKKWKRAQPKDLVRASVMDAGLWRCTRHPTTSATPASGGAYPEYMRRTSGFFPWPPKAEPSGPDTARPQRSDISLLV